MQTLMDLLATSEGFRFLESEGVFVTPQAFKSQLERPVKPDLVNDFGGRNTKLICSGQQLYIDYRRSVLSKILALQDLERDEDIFSFFLWVDTDRTGSDNLITKFAWPNSSKKGPITIMPPRTRDIEIRFVSPEPAQMASAIDKLETHLRQSGERKEGAKQKYQQLRMIFTNHDHETLSQFNLRLTNFLLSSVFGFAPHPTLLSDLLEKGIILDEVNLFVNQITDVVSVFNEAVHTLIKRDIDPQVTPLDENYLPLFYSCDVDGKRLRLYHHLDGQDHFAVAACKCGQEYKFFLGRKTLSISEIAQTHRWSPDVCFPIFFNDLVSGFVAGKSSAIYLIVLNKVLRKVLNKTPAPILAPESLGAKENGSVRFDSLIYRYFAGV